jgi:hypothetical protein
MRRGVRRTRLVILAALVVAMMTLKNAPPARAESDASKALSTVQVAKRMFKEGRYTLALGLFGEAYDLFPSPKVKYSIGLCLMKLEKWSEALPVWDMLRDEPVLAAVRPKIDGFIARCEARGFGHLRLSDVPEGALVSLDGMELPPGRQWYERILPGAHILRMVHTDYHDWEARVEVAVGETTSVRITPVEVGSFIVVTPIAPEPPASEPAVAPNDLSGRVEVEERGVSATTWALIGTGAAALVAVGVTVAVVLQSDDAPPAEDMVLRISKPLRGRR